VERKAKRGIDIQKDGWISTQRDRHVYRKIAEWTEKEIDRVKDCRTGNRGTDRKRMIDRKTRDG
jgi:hypothetical protein